VSGNIYAGAISAQRDNMHYVIALSFYISDNQSVLIHLYKRALELFPLEQGYCKHTSSFCTVLPNAIEQYLAENSLL
jgi:hypothetical protein